MKDKNRVCPVELADSLDSRLRRLVQNPGNIINPFVKEGMTVLDIGCGPGFFTIELALQVGASGKVYAADMQSGMLDKVKKKISGTPLDKIIELHKTEGDKINLPCNMDFILVFYVLHEIPDKLGFFNELKRLLKPGGKVFVAEPFFHVNGKDFEKEMKQAAHAGFSITRGLKISIGRYALLTNN